MSSPNPAESVPLAEVVASTTSLGTELVELGLDQTLLDSYQLAIDRGAFAVGDRRIDATVGATLPLARYLTLRHIRTGIGAVTAGILTIGPSQRIEGTLWLMSRVPEIEESIWDRPEVGVWCNERITTEDAGLKRSRNLEMLTTSIELNYAPALRGPVAPRAKPGNVVLSGLEFATKKLLGRRERDLTKETLDTRFQCAVAITQLEVADLFLRDVLDLGEVGRPGAEHAVRLAKEHLPALLHNDLPTKRAMMAATGEAFRSVQHRWPQDGTGNIMLDIMANRSSNVATGIDELLELFRSIYTNLGYELPTLLRPPQAVVVAAIGESVTRVEVDPSAAEASTPDTEQTDTIDPALRQEMTDRSDTISAAVARFNKSWTLTHKRRKDRDLAALTYALQKGFVDDLGQASLGPLANAQSLVDVIVHLQEIAGTGSSIEEAAGSLSAAIAEERLLHSQIGELRTWASDHDIPYHHSDISAVADVARVVTRIERDWSQLRQAISRHWPNSQGPIAAREIEQLLRAWRGRTSAKE